MLLTHILRKTSFPLQTASRAVSNYGSLDSPLVNPTFIDVALSQLLKNKKAKKSDVNEFIEHYKTKMNRQNFISMLRGCRRRRVLEPRHIYTAACGLKYAEDEALSSAQFDQIFHSISFMSHRVASVRVLLTVTSDALDICEDKFTIDQVANYVYSLTRMKSGVPEVRELLRVLMNKLATCDEKMSNDSASKLIGGFQGLSSKYPEVRLAVTAVLQQLETNNASIGAFNEAEASRALLGMKRLSSEVADVRKLMSYVLTKSETSPSLNLSGFQVSQAILAVQSMDTDTPESSALFCFLTQQVEQLEGDGKALVAKNVKEALMSLGAAKTNKEEVVSLSAALQRAKVA